MQLKMEKCVLLYCIVVVKQYYIKAEYFGKLLLTIIGKNKALFCSEILNLISKSDFSNLRCKELNTCSLNQVN